MAVSSRSIAWGAVVVLVLTVPVVLILRGDPMEGCIEVSRERLDRIALALTVEGGSLREGWAYRSPAHTEAYFVAAEIDGPGLEDEGDDELWFVTSFESVAGIVLPVGEARTGFVTSGDAGDIDARVSSSDPGAQEARTCLRRAQARS